MFRSIATAGVRLPPYQGWTSTAYLPRMRYPPVPYNAVTAPRYIGCPWSCRLDARRPYGSFG
eukprot:987862-Karenia_brevis.AAC.1